MIDSDPNKPLIAWAALPGKPDLVSVHPAPTLQDVRDALREAQRKQPQWVILDTEGSLRGAMAFTTIRLDAVLTPLAGSQLEAAQAIKAAEMVEEFGGRSERRLLHRCVLTRVPAALRPRGLKAVVEQLHARDIAFLATPLIEKEAFRSLFAIGGGFAELEAAGVTGIVAAKQNADAYVDAVVALVPRGTAGGA
jgi:chromosome partitioning protein